MFTERSLFSLSLGHFNQGPTTFSISLSRSHIHTFTQSATLNIHEDSYPFLPPTSATSADFTSKIPPPAPSPLHSKAVSLYHHHSHPIIHSAHIAKLIFKQVKQTTSFYSSRQNSLLKSIPLTNKDLLNSTGNSAQCYVAAWMGREFGGEWIHVYVWLSPFTLHLKLAQYW